MSPQRFEMLVGLYGDDRTAQILSENAMVGTWLAGAVFVPVNARATDTELHHIMTVNLSAGTIDHVVNGVGGPADTTKVGVPVYIAEYPAP